MSGSATGGGLLPWLVDRKVAVPGPAVGHLARAALADAAMPTRRRLTVLQATGGFGKTTLLAECCRRLRDDGVPVAWVTVDGDEGPGVLDTYVAYACERATAGAARGSAGPPAVEAAPPGDGGRTALALRAVAALDGPFVLALDQVERLPDAASTALVSFVLDRGPPNLHLAMTCRRIPAGLDVAGAVLDGRGSIVSTEDLRFSRAEAAEFLGGGMGKARLDALMTESAGWPLALRVARNELVAARGVGGSASGGFVENWVEARLFAELGAEDRDFLLDIGLFEWMDPALVDEALECGGSGSRIETMPVLAGLVGSVRDGAAQVLRLHPLIREHCARARLRETPQRFRDIHRRIAEALARRGDTVAAMRHALEAGAPALADGFLERAGGMRLFLREGAVRMRAANGLLSEDGAARSPRLALVRCVASILSGRMEDARERFADVAPADGADGEAALDLAADRCMVRGLLAHHGSERLGSKGVRAHLTEVAGFAESPVIDAGTRGYMAYSLCLAAGMRGDFGTASEQAALARRCFGDSPYMTMFLEIQAGQAALAQGRPRDAAALYRRARRTAKLSYVADPEPVGVCAVLLDELALERGGAAPGAGRDRIPAAFERGNSPFQSYAAAAGAAVERRVRRGDAAAALAGLEEMLAYVRGARLPALERYLAALRASVLAASGQTAEAARRWAADGLPGRAAGCLDIAGQSWREMEALSCARLRMDIGAGRFGEARSFAGELRALAAARGLRRTLMRGLALEVALEVRAGHDGAAAERLREYLALYAETPYAGPLVRERAECGSVAAALREGGMLEADPGAAQAARSVSAAMAAADAGGAALDGREAEVLRLLADGQRDRGIAEALGLSVDGVRHHLRKLFARFGVNRRGELVQAVLDLGLIEES